MKWKQLTAALAALAMITGTVGILPSVPGVETVLTAKAEEYHGLTYTVWEDGTISITDCDETLTSVEIPAEIDGNPVVYIEDYAFSGCDKLTSVTIPDSVTSIGYGAFLDCTGLTDITIPESVTRIDGAAFHGCTGLQRIMIPDNVMRIEDSTFYGCAELTSITIPDGITYIGSGAFANCTKLMEISIPDSVTSVGFEAFYHAAWYDAQPDGVVYLGKCLYEYKGEMPDNTAVAIADGTSEIADQAFRGCTGLTEIVIPDSVTSIGAYSFQDCTGLTNITIPDTVTNIGRNAFSDCTGLTSITIPDGITNIGAEAFENTAWYNVQPDGIVYLVKYLYAYKGEMPDHTSIAIEDGTTYIAEHAFAGRTGLTEIIIPDSVTKIDSRAFMSCTDLTSITIPDSVTEIGISAFTNCTALTSVTIPDSITNIDDYTFNSTGLTEVTIPDSVTRIGYCAFSYCEELTDITILNPDCIFERNYYNPDPTPETTTIHGYENSTAQAYATANGNPFVSLGEAPVLHPLYGDANDDGEVTIVDVVKLCRCAMGADTLTKAGAINADVDGNGTADATDASYIIQSLVGLVELPVAN